MVKKDNDNYIDQFIDEQNKQYIQWEYLASGDPPPLYEAKGNPKLLGLWFLFSGSLALAVGAFASYLCKDLRPILFLGLSAIFAYAVAAGYFRKHFAHKKALENKNGTSNRSKKRRRK